MTQIPPEAPPLPEYPAPPPRETRGKGLAIAALVCGICGFIPCFGLLPGLVGVILGIVAMAIGTRARGMAIAGLATGCAGLGLHVLFLLAGFIGLPLGMGRSRELAKQAACMANLNSVGKAIALYTTNNDDQFPTLWPQGNPNAALEATSHANVWSIRSTNSMNNVWLLVKEGMVGENAFHCPSDKDWKPRAAPGTYGWADLGQFSYGMHWPYDGDGSTANPARLSDPNLDGGLAIMADRNPGGPVGAGRKPSNHAKDGQAVLYRAYWVNFYKSLTDSKAGAAADDIYINTSRTAGGMPQDPNDTSITPVPSR